MQQEPTTQTSAAAFNQINFNSLPETGGFCKLWQIVGDKKRNIPAVLPISRSTFLSRVKDGTYPQPVKLGARSVAWRVQDIRALLAEIGG
ncbi:helix-turn-helix transcriptional regulator [Methylobacter sp.]|uniref:helix-turn-helix transcriptional regulator n=1 Tax=Methylobacter sp. TaxID=2051955 RepID=UPI002FDCE508